MLRPSAGFRLPHCAVPWPQFRSLRGALATIQYIVRYLGLSLLAGFPGHIQYNCAVPFSAPSSPNPLVQYLGITNPFGAAPWPL